MTLFENSSLYKASIEIYEKLDELLSKAEAKTTLKTAGTTESKTKAKTKRKFKAKTKESFLTEKLRSAALELTTTTALALYRNNKEDFKVALKETAYSVISICNLLHVAEQKNLISSSASYNIRKDIKAFMNIVDNYEKYQKKILILSSIYGQGHMSAAKAIKEGIEAKYGCDYEVEIIDFVEKIGSLLNKTFYNLYEGSTKFVPSVYKFFFESTDKRWQIRFLNIINYPLNASKIERMFIEKNPTLLISTFPIWDYLAHLVRKKNGNKSLKFISVVTDSISLHNAWASGEPDYHIVANEDTAHSLKKLGVDKDKIKILGFPVKLSFLEKSDREQFFKKLKLNPKKFTIILLPTIENIKKTLHYINEIQNDPSLNLIVITGRNYELEPKLNKKTYNKNVKIIGWTDQMVDFIKCSDLVITKAGGATVMECIAAEKPMIINKIIPGQEMGNAELIKRYSLGIVIAGTNISITEAINDIKGNYSFYQNNLKKVSNPEASLEIAEFIHKLLK